VEKGISEMMRKRYVTMAISASIACILQAIGLYRYINRLPDDWLGIGLFITTLIIFAIAAIGFFMKWRKTKKEAGYGT